MAPCVVRSIAPLTIGQLRFDGALRVPKRTQTRLGSHHMSLPHRPQRTQSPLGNPSASISPRLSLGAHLTAPGPHLFLDVCSGAHAPLSAALSGFDRAVLPIDILVSPEMDLLNDLFFEDLLRLCASGLVAYCGASPPCSEFSLLKLRSPGP